MSGTLPDVLRVAGVDVGSSAVKVALMQVPSEDRATMKVGRAERIRRRDPVAVADELFDACLAEAGWSREDLHYTATTGEGDSLEIRTAH